MHDLAYHSLGVRLLVCHLQGFQATPALRLRNFPAFGPRNLPPVFCAHEVVVAESLRVYAATSGKIEEGLRADIDHKTQTSAPVLASPASFLPETAPFRAAPLHRAKCRCMLQPSSAAKALAPPVCRAIQRSWHEHCHREVGSARVISQRRMNVHKSSRSSPDGITSSDAWLAGTYARGSLAWAAAPAEVRLVIACTQAPDQEDRLAAVQEAVEVKVDWHEVQGQAAWHGVLPLVESTLTRCAPDVVPAAVLEGLRRYRRATGIRNLFLFSRLVDLLERFQSAGIPAIPLKGSILAHTVYEDPSLREFADLDILVPRMHVTRASGLLHSLGFQGAPWAEEGRPPRADQWFQYAGGYTRSADGVTVDLHWHLVLPMFGAGIRMARLWEETRICEIGGTPFHAFTPEATLLVLCIHGAKHGPTAWPRLKWVVDVDRVVRTSRNLDWEALGRLAADLGCRRILLVGVALAAEFLKTPVPTTLLAWAQRDATTRKLIQRSRASLLEGPRANTDSARNIAYRLALRERWRDKLSTFLRGLLIPQTDDWHSVRLPARLSFVYIPIRLARLAGRLPAVVVSSLAAGFPARPEQRNRDAKPEAVGAAEVPQPDTSGESQTGRSPRTALEAQPNRVVSDGQAKTAPLGLHHQIHLSGLILWDWVGIRWNLRRRPLPELIARLNRQGRARPHLAPERLGRIVHRVMNVGPFRPRCLTMSLVLFRELRRQGTAAEVVIGLPPEAREHTAHAWVEVDRRVVGPPPGRLDHAEMARYSGAASGVSSNSFGET